MTPEKRYSLDLQEQNRLRNQKPIDDTIKRNSAKVLSSSNNLSALHDSNNNPFNNAVVRDAKKLSAFNERKRQMQISMSKLIADMNSEEFDRFESTINTYILTQ